MKTSHEADRHIVALLAIVIAFVLFIIFVKNQDFLIETNMQNSYVVMTAIGLGLVMTLVYMVSNRGGKSTKRVKSSSKKRRR